MAQAKAILKNVPTSPQKMRYVVDTIRGVDVEKALNLLKFSSKHAAKEVEKLLLSATNNWKEKNHGHNPEDSQLFVKEIFVDGGTMLKRWLPAPHGRAYKKRKRSNHVTIIVDSRVIIDEVGVTEEAEETVAEVTETVKTEAEKTPKAKSPRKRASKKKKEEETGESENTEETK